MVVHFAALRLSLALRFQPSVIFTDSVYFFFQSVQPMAVSGGTGNHGDVQFFRQQFKIQFDSLFSGLITEIYTQDDTGQQGILQITDLL